MISSKTTERLNVTKAKGKQASVPPAKELPPEIGWFGANMRRFRQESGKTLRDFCAEAGMSYSFLSSVELGKTNLGLGYAIALSRLVGVPFTDMIKPPAANRRIFRAANFVADEEPEASAKLAKRGRGRST